jgi:hypothetical protein
MRRSSRASAYYAIAVVSPAVSAATTSIAYCSASIAHHHRTAAFACADDRSLVSWTIILLLFPQQAIIAITIPHFGHSGHL